MKSIIEYLKEDTVPIILGFCFGIIFMVIIGKVDDIITDFDFMNSTILSMCSLFLIFGNSSILI